MLFITVLLFSAATFAAPVEDTPEVAEAKAAFSVAFSEAEAGQHAALAPVNPDVQAEQIPNAYIDDAPEVAEARSAFMAEFEKAEAGGLVDLQAPAPVHEIAAPTVYNALPLVHPVLPYAYAAQPYAYAYNAYPYSLGAYAPYAYSGLPVITLPKTE